MGVASLANTSFWAQLESCASRTYSIVICSHALVSCCHHSSQNRRCNIQFSSGCGAAHVQDSAATSQVQVRSQPLSMPFM